MQGGEAEDAGRGLGRSLQGGHAEVGQRRLPELRDEDVLRLHVAVEEAVAMGRFEGSGDLDPRAGDLHRVHRAPPAELVAERLAAQLEHQGGTAVDGRGRPVQGDDVRVVAHCRQRVDLAVERLDQLGVDGVDLQDLECDRPARLELGRPEHSCEGAAADLVEVGVSREKLVDGVAPLASHRGRD